ncbi:MAG: hypothetical protein ACRDT4_13750 [Micromonosporaceae bacterium]
MQIWSGRLRRRGSIALAGVVAVGLLAAAGVAGATENTTSVVRKGVVKTADAPPSATLATGERITLVPGAAGSPDDVRIAPAPGRPLGQYGYGFVNGMLQVRPSSPRPVTTTELRTGDAKPSATTDATAYPVTIKIVNAPVASKLLYVWDRTTWELRHIGVEPGPSTSVDLPTGDYFTVALHQDAGRPSYLLTKAFRVGTSGLTVQLDEALAKETGINVDNADAARAAAGVSVAHPGGVVGFASHGSAKVYTTPFSVPGAALRIHELKTRTRSTAPAPSPYRYDLVHSFQDTVPASPLVQVQTANLAKTVTAVRGPGTRTRAELHSVARFGDTGGWLLGAAVAAPGTVTEYVTPSRGFGRILLYGTYDHQLILADRTLSPGTSPGETLGAAPFSLTRGASLSSRQQGTSMSLYEASAFSAVGDNRGYDDRGTTSIRLTAGGATLAEAYDIPAHEALHATVPNEPTAYRYEHTVNRRVPYSRLSTQVRSEWEFVSSGTPHWTELALIDARVAVSGLDGFNRAAAGAVVRIDATADTRRVTTDENLIGIEYSTDDGATWLALPVTGEGASRSAELTVPGTASFVSLRVTATNNGSLRRTILRAFAGPVPLGDETVGATTISNVVANGGKPIVAHGYTTFGFPATFTATDPSGIARGDLYLYRGGYDAPDAVLIGQSPATCNPVNATTATCTVNFQFNARHDLGRNALAGTWKAAAWAHSSDRTSFTDRHAAASVSVLRATTLTVDATPEPVYKGKPITVTGKLLRANWETYSYQAYSGQPVKLQYRRYGTDAYVTVKTVYTDSYGNLRTTVTASYDGLYRWVYAGNAITQPITTAGDYIDVR